MSANNGLKLAFSTNVLSKEAAQRLRDKKITQTIRSRKGTAPFFKARGSHVNILLDEEVLYRARITEIVRISSLQDLNPFDAEIGGFDDMTGLHAALRKAGFRFRDLNSYAAFKIQFLAERKGGISPA